MSAFYGHSDLTNSHKNDTLGWSYTNLMNNSLDWCYFGLSVNRCSRIFHMPLNMFQKSKKYMASFIIAVMMWHPLSMSITFPHRRDAFLVYCDRKGSMTVFYQWQQDHGQRLAIVSSSCMKHGPLCEHWKLLGDGDHLHSFMMKASCQIGWVYYRLTVTCENSYHS